MSDSPFCAIGADVGGTKIAAGLVTFPSGELRNRRQIPTNHTRGGGAVYTDVFLLCEELTTATQSQGGRVAGIGIGLCVLVNLEGRPVSENCIAWNRVPVRERLSKLAPTVI